MADVKRIFNDIRLMDKLTRQMRQRRIAGGGLTFEIPKKEFLLDQNQYPISYNIKKRGHAHFLVEELMLIANQKVGEIIVAEAKDALLRRHKFPSDKKITKFEAFMQKVGRPLVVRKGHIQE